MQIENLRELRELMTQIAPSILSADFSRLGEEIDAVERGGADVLHFDVMDGHFVPNITIGLPVLRSLKGKTRLPIDAHLMITDPGVYAEQFVDAGASMVSVHVEADANLHRTLTSIKARGAMAGVAINPGTSLACLEDAVLFADYILLMSVNPGFGGQEFIRASIDKVRRLRLMLDDRRSKARIEIDGGIGPKNIGEVVSAGAEIIVSGSAIFGASDSSAAVRELREATVQWV